MAITSTRTIFNIVQRAKASYERIEEIENTPNDIDTDYKLNTRPFGNIEFNIKNLISRVIRKKVSIMYILKLGRVLLWASLEELVQGKVR